MSRTVLMTGGTGMIGSRLGLELLERGDKVIFPIRSARTRLESKIRVYNSAFNIKDYEAQVIEGKDIILPNFCFDKTELQSLKKEQIDVLYATAGAIDFDPEKAELVKRTNVDGFYNTLELAEVLDIPLVVVFSTAYVGGKFHGKFLETDLDRDQCWNNTYEESKFRGEVEAHEWAERTGRKIIIVRPAIVIGAPETISFAGYYYVFKSLWIVGNHARQQLAQDSPKYFGTGIRVLHNSDLLSLPITMLCRKESTANLVPVDWLCKTVLAISELAISEKEDVVGKTFNLTHPNPVPMHWLIETSAKLVGVTNLSLEEPDQAATREDIQRLLYGNGLLHRLQKQFDTAIREYVPYMCTRLTFDNRNVRNVLGDDYEEPPEIDEVFLAERLDYAKKLHFKEQGGLSSSKKMLTKSHPLLNKAY